MLVGNHQKNTDNLNNPLLKKMLDEIISKWPREMVVNGRDLGGEVEDGVIKFAKLERIKYNKMKRLLYKSGVINGTTLNNKISAQYIKEEAISLVPDYKDRLLISKSIIYKQPLLYNSSLKNIKIIREDNVQTLVYLDVSGSVIDDINHFAPLLLKPYKNKQCLLFAFSTIVVPVTYDDFKKGKYRSTRGTSINCIFDHFFALEKKQTKKILILTDGHTGKINESLLLRIKERKIQVYCGLFGNYTKDDMSNIVKYYEEFN